MRSLTFGKLCVQLSQFFKHWRRQGRFWRLCHTCGSWLQQRFCNKKEEIYDIKRARQQLFDCVYVQHSSDRARNTPESHVSSSFPQATQRSTGLHTLPFTVQNFRPIKTCDYTSFVFCLSFLRNAKIDPTLFYFYWLAWSRVVCNVPSSKEN